MTRPALGYQLREARLRGQFKGKVKISSMGLANERCGVYVIEAVAQ